MQTPRQVATSQTYPGRAKYGSRESRLECIENPFLWRARKPHASALSSGCDAHDQQVRHAPWDRGAQESRSLLVGHRYRYPFGTPKERAMRIAPGQEQEPQTGETPFIELAYEPSALQRARSNNGSGFMGRRGGRALRYTEAPRPPTARPRRW